MMVVGGNEGVDRDDAVTARLVLDHDRLALLATQVVGKQPGPDIDAAGRPQRDNEPDRPLRPVLRR